MILAVGGYLFGTCLVPRTYLAPDGGGVNYPQNRKIKNFRRKSIQYQKILEIFAQNLVF